MFTGRDRVSCEAVLDFFDIRNLFSNLIYTDTVNTDKKSFYYCKQIQNFDYENIYITDDQKEYLYFNEQGIRTYIADWFIKRNFDVAYPNNKLKTLDELKNIIVDL